MNNNGKGVFGGPGNSSNPRPGQSPFPQSNALVRQPTINSQKSQQNQQSQPYTSSYSNNFDRTNARYSTGRTEESSRYSAENPAEYTIPPISPLRRQPKQEQQNRGWDESIYGMYGDLNTPRDPPPRQNQQRRRQNQQPREDDEDSYDEEVPRRPNPEPERPRYTRSRTSPEAGQRRTTPPRRDQQNDRQGRQGRQERQDRQDRQNGDGNFRRVHVNIDTGGDGGSRSWTWSSDEPGRTNVNIGTPFGGGGPNLVNFGTPVNFGGEGGFLFGGRSNARGLPFVNLPFGL